MLQTNSPVAGLDDTFGNRSSLSTATTGPRADNREHQPDMSAKQYRATVELLRPHGTMTTHLRTLNWLVGSVGRSLTLNIERAQKSRKPTNSTLELLIV
jgi:hypothetical protein